MIQTNISLQNAKGFCIGRSKVFILKAKIKEGKIISSTLSMSITMQQGRILFPLSSMSRQGIQKYKKNQIHELWATLKEIKGNKLNDDSV